MSSKVLQRRGIIIAFIIPLLLSACTTGSEPAPTATVVSAPPSPTTASQPVAPTNTVAVAPPTVTTASVARPEMKNPDTLVEGVTGDAQTLDPAWLYDTSSGEVVFQVYETLLMFKREKTDEYVPLLATKWDISQDGKTYTFNIRKGVKFHEGQDLTPEDVAYSVWRGVMQDRSGGPQWIMLQPLFGLDVLSFKDGVVDKQFNKDWVAACEGVKKAVTFDNAAGTVTYNLKQPYGPMLQILTGPWAAVVNKSWVASKGGWDGDCKNAEKHHDPKVGDDELFKVMNGTGPYKLQRWTPGEEIALTRNDNYWLKEPLWEGGPSGPASTKNVLIKIMQEWGTRFGALQAGDLDFAMVDTQYIAQIDPLVKETCGPTGNCTPLSANGTLRLHKNLPAAAADAIFFNQNIDNTGSTNRIGSGKLDGNGIPPNFFSDINVRKAFNYCFDWATFIKDVWHDEAEQAYGPIIKGMLGYDASQAHYSLDLTRCADEFKASTLKSESGASLWDTGFSLQYVYDTGTDNRKTAGEILKANLAAVNPKFKLEIANEPWPAMLDELTGKHLPLFMVGWIEDFHDPHDWMLPYMSSGGAFSAFQGLPKELTDKTDSLIAQGIGTADPAERAKIYQQLQNMAYENALDIFLEQPQQRRYEQLWVKGWYFNPTYFGSGYPGVYFYALSKGK